MTPSDQFKAHQQALHLVNREMAALLQVSERTIERWRSGQNGIPKVVFRYLALYRRVADNAPQLLKEI